MKTEALIGKELGSSTLQRLIGHGTLGTVYLAQQSRPRRQVAVKVFVRAAALEPPLLDEFLARFQHEVDAASSLEHPHILSIHEYGQHVKLAYLVMPFVKGGTLRDRLERDSALPLSTAADYLEQLATAVDFAHSKAIIHRDIKPGNVLIASDGRLLLADFGLTNVVSEGKMASVRLAAAGMLDYMAPEQVVGKRIDSRADIYSLGVVLYHMVTGTVPFKGETLTQVAVKHLQVPPPSPRALRPDLPLEAEQVILRALAKRPGERYQHAQELASAFRLALQSSVEAQTQTGQLREQSGTYEINTQPASHKPHSLFDPQWQTGTLNVVHNGRQDTGADKALPWASHGQTGFLQEPTTSSGTGQFRMLGKTSRSATQEDRASGQALETPVKADPVSPSPDAGTTGALRLQNYEPGNTGTIKLTGPAKVVRVPVAGQPGQYVTGLLPVLPAAEPQSSPGRPAGARNRNVKVLATALLVLLLVGSGIFAFARIRSNQSPSTAQNKLHNKPMMVNQTPDIAATATADVKATAEANIILSDPLDHNIHNWLVKNTGTTLYQFQNGAYVITNNDPARGAPAILQGVTLSSPFGYALTMEEIRGDDNSINNAFGMILRATTQQKGGRTITTFYSFEVTNNPGGEYEFWKYDDSQGSKANPWQELWHQPFGKEFHEGHGPKSINTFKVFANGKSFTLTVNGKHVGTVQDGSFSSGAVGMLVNQKGTEVAFSNLLLTRN
ncbi:MAG TPA: serine/threonine-protein kinase [Ktedonobacteraceae bacterium]|jgi:serine/threonine protein kinase|nr:serine/threonine-protein kinase [Ktedonobacteraceae bacterium]